MPEPPAKRLKTGKPARKFTTPDEIRTSLRSQSAEDLTQGSLLPTIPRSVLYTLCSSGRVEKSFLVWPNEGPISTQDARLVLAQKWLDASPGAHDLFTIWEKSNARQPASITPIISLLSSLLTLLFPLHVSCGWTPDTANTAHTSVDEEAQLVSRGSHTELLLVTLKLFNSMAAFGGGRERKSVLESFAWETKSLPKLLNMRRKSKADDSSDPLAKPDIRTLYMFFCLSFVDQENSTQLKTMFLEQHRDAFFSIFRGLAQDPFVVIRKVLEICWTGIWLDPKIKRTLKIGLFSEITVAQLVKIYERANSEDDDAEHVPADVVHHFLLAICTRPGIGICFKDRGWYPRKSETEGAQDDEGDVPSRDRGKKIYNKILANILKRSRSWLHAPNFYWSAAGLTLEPRLVLRTVLSLPVPADSFLSDNGAHLSRGLQQPSGLVQHCTALALCKFQAIEAALEEDRADGQWAKMRRDLESEVRHRVPEFQVVVARAKGAAAAAPPHPTKEALLAESAQRLLWMYHSYLPLLVAETRFDVGKLVQNLWISRAGANLHVLRLLAESDQFVWSGKTASSGKTHLHVFLDAFSACENPALRKTLNGLVVHLLADSIIFQNNQEEPSFGFSLEDEADVVIGFLDDCVQRCLRTPYNQHGAGTTPDDLPSPLIMAVVEQLSAKVAASKQALSPSHVFVLVMFLRRLVLRLSSHVAAKVQESLGREMKGMRGCLPSTHAPRPLNANGDVPSSRLRNWPVADIYLAEEDARRIATAFEVVDQVRLAGSYSLSQIRTSAEIVALFDSEQKLLWDGLNITQESPDVLHHLTFDCLFHHSSVDDINDVARREILANAAVANAPTLADMKRVVFLVNHIDQRLVLLITAIFKQSALLLSLADFADLKEELFLRSAVLADLCTTTDVPEVVSQGLRLLVELILDPTKSEDRQLVSNITKHWLNVLTDSGSSSHRAISPWIRFMEPQDLFGLLQLFGADSQTNPQLLEMLIAALETAVKAQSIADLHSHLHLLITLRPALPKSVILESMIATIVDACIPVALGAAWSNRFHLVPASLDLQSLLFQDADWSDSTISILTAVLYQSGCNSDTFSSWLTTDFASRSQTDTSAWVPHLSRLLKALTDGKATSTLRTECSSCIRLVLARIPSTIPEFLAALQHRTGRLSDSFLGREILTLGNWLAKDSDKGKLAVAPLIEHGMQWCIRAFADPNVDNDILDVVDDLGELPTSQKLLSVIIQNRLADVSAISLLSAVLRTVPLKPLVVNRYLQSIVQHPQFFKVCAAGAQKTPLRNQIIHALHVLFNLHPANTCQVTHVQPLVRIYHGTASTADRKLLSIFQLFESERKVSVASLLGQWSATQESLDAILVLRTCLHFPKWRYAQLYDPVFLVLIFAQAMAEKIPESAFGWIELFRTNIVSLLIRAMSAKDQQLRAVTRSQLAALWAHLETADMQEQPHVVYVFNVLRNLLPPPTTEPAPRLPSYTTLILLHALRGIFYPSNFIYPLTARFLLQRPTLDVTDVPMLYGMLYSSSDDWKKERGWIIRFISDGMMSTDDWRVLKRRHTWELLAGLFQSSDQDLTLRNSVLEVLANLTCNAQATTSLILKSSLLHWIEMQLLLSTTEAVAWVKILENILIVVDAQKMESSTGGEWRFVICRCLSLILQGMHRSLKADGISATAAPVIWRLSALPGPSAHALPDLLDHSFKGLELLETQIEFPRSRPTGLRSASVPCMPPHSGEDLHVVGDFDPLLTWGKSVEYLWQAGLGWDVLTPRLLVWRSVFGEEGSAVGEWARILTVQSLRIVGD
ncbi:ribosome 60S biogenesis N-terminal-domain-containing protein [Mycena olivaceomarginata]|nr:ribosome 60S biogenesis N-terminal-domain-containing protein [Mycena olivaceomarginata]